MIEFAAHTSSCWRAPPSPQELDRARSFLKTQAEMIRNEKPARKPGRQFASLDPAESAAWVDFALALLNCNEFLYVP